MFDTYNFVIDTIALVCVTFIVFVLLLSAWDLFRLTPINANVVSRFITPYVNSAGSFVIPYDRVADNTPTYRATAVATFVIVGLLLIFWGVLIAMFVLGLKLRNAKAFVIVRG